MQGATATQAGDSSAGCTTSAGALPSRFTLTIAWMAAQRCKAGTGKGLLRVRIGEEQGDRPCTSRSGGTPRRLP